MTKSTTRSVSAEEVEMNLTLRYIKAAICMVWFLFTNCDLSVALTYDITRLLVKFDCMSQQVSNRHTITIHFDVISSLLYAHI